MLSRLGINYYNNYKDQTNIYFLKVAIRALYKLKGSSTLNNRYRRLLSLKLRDYKDISEYTRKFKEIYNDIRNMYKTLRVDKNLLIFLFYTSLRKEYKDYFTRYT